MSTPPDPSALPGFIGQAQRELLACGGLPHETAATAIAWLATLSGNPAHLPPAAVVLAPTDPATRVSPATADSILRFRDPAGCRIGCELGCHLAGVDPSRCLPCTDGGPLHLVDAKDGWPALCLACGQLLPPPATPPRQVSDEAVTAVQPSAPVAAARADVIDANVLHALYTARSVTVERARAVWLASSPAQEPRAGQSLASAQRERDQLLDLIEYAIGRPIAVYAERAARASTRLILRGGAPGAAELYHAGVRDPDRPQGA